MAKYAPDVIPTCITCDTRNETKSCLKCAVVFCKHFASTTDIRFCANCIGDVHVKESIIEKTVEHIKADGTVSFSRKYQATMIKLEGVDWLFAHNLIEESSDAEIDAAIEYHRANVDLMLMEREARKKERMLKLANVKVIHKKNETQIEREAREQRELNKKTRTKTKVKETTAEDLLAALMQLAKAGLSADQISSMLQNGGKK